eukprot:GHVH01000735.1.p1 GENE.GHVH01000735.1~~GHVH01000735.1.p1  ORF type:complete len:954 (+),score=122.88 GHVH01000735.1:1836-4697(+)
MSGRRVIGETLNFKIEEKAISNGIHETDLRPSRFSGPYSTSGGGAKREVTRNRQSTKGAACEEKSNTANAINSQRLAISIDESIKLLLSSREVLGIALMRCVDVVHASTRKPGGSCDPFSHHEFNSLPRNVHSRIDSDLLSSLTLRRGFSYSSSIVRKVSHENTALVANMKHLNLNYLIQLVGPESPQSYIPCTLDPTKIDYDTYLSCGDTVCTAVDLNTAAPYSSVPPPHFKSSVTSKGCRSKLIGVHQTEPIFMSMSDSVKLKVNRDTLCCYTHEPDVQLNLKYCHDLAVHVGVRPTYDIPIQTPNHRYERGTHGIFNLETMDNLSQNTFFKTNRDWTVLPRRALQAHPTQSRYFINHFQGSTCLDLRVVPRNTPGFPPRGSQAPIVIKPQSVHRVLLGNNMTVNRNADQYCYDSHPFQQRACPSCLGIVKPVQHPSVDELRAFNEMYRQFNSGANLESLECPTMVDSPRKANDSDQTIVTWYGFVPEPLSEVHEGLSKSVTSMLSHKRRMQVHFSSMDETKQLDTMSALRLSLSSMALYADEDISNVVFHPSYPEYCVVTTIRTDTLTHNVVPVVAPSADSLGRCPTMTHDEYRRSWGPFYNTDGHLLVEASVKSLPCGQELLRKLRGPIGKEDSGENCYGIHSSAPSLAHPTVQIIVCEMKKALSGSNDDTGCLSGAISLEAPPPPLWLLNDSGVISNKVDLHVNQLMTPQGRSKEKTLQDLPTVSAIVESASKAVAMRSMNMIEHRIQSKMNEVGKKSPQSTQGATLSEWPPESIEDTDLQYVDMIGNQRDGDCIPMWRDHSASLWMDIVRQRGSASHSAHDRSIHSSLLLESLSPVVRMNECRPIIFQSCNLVMMLTLFQSIGLWSFDGRFLFHVGPFQDSPLSFVFDELKWIVVVTCRQHVEVWAVPETHRGIDDGSKVLRPAMGKPNKIGGYQIDINEIYRLQSI